MEGGARPDHSTHSQTCRCVEGDHKADSGMTGIIHDIVRDISRVLLVHMRTADGGRESASRTRLRTALDQLDTALNDLVKEEGEETQHGGD